jgi:hypothetical protein
MIRSMATGCSHGRAVICTKVIIERMREKDMGKCTGQMEPYTKGSGEKAVSMERGSCYSQMGVY